MTTLISRSLSPDIVTVFQLGGDWIGIKFQENHGKGVLIKSTDQKTATLAAQRFAKIHQCHFCENIFYLTKGIVTLYKVFGQWNPGIIYANKIEIQGIAQMTRDEAMTQAKLLATNKGLLFLETLGEQIVKLKNFNYS